VHVGGTKGHDSASTLKSFLKDCFEVTISLTSSHNVWYKTLCANYHLTAVHALLYTSPRYILSNGAGYNRHYSHRPDLTRPISHLPSHRLISPSQHACVNPSCSTIFLHLSPPLSLFFIYLNSFCRLCTNSLKFRLFTLSFLPRVSKKSANTLIFAVRIAICTSLLPVSGPARGVASEGLSPLAEAS
jgi:hypothetical protein